MRDYILGAMVVVGLLAGAAPVQAGVVRAGASAVSAFAAASMKCPVVKAPVKAVGFVGKLAKRVVW